jgi:hypothetical protein
MLQRLQPNDVVDLLQAALTNEERLGTEQRVQAICTLQAAQSPTARALVPIAVAAMCSSDWQPLSLLLELPAAAGLSGADMDTLLHAAVDAVGQHGESHAVHLETLSRLSGAAAAGSEALVAALHASISSDSSGGVINVCKMLAKQQRDVPAALLAGLLKAAHSKGMSHCVWMLLDLPQARQLQESTVADCLQQVLQERPRRDMGDLVSAVERRKSMLALYVCYH